MKCRVLLLLMLSVLLAVTSVAAAPHDEFATVSEETTDYIGAMAGADAYIGTVVLNTEGYNVSLATRSTILSYMYDYYESLAHLYQGDPTVYFAEGNDNFAAVDYAVWELMYIFRAMQNNYLTLDSYHCTMEVIDYTETEEYTEVTLNETIEQYFTHTDGACTEQVNILHTFRIKHSEGYAKIVYHYIDNRFYEYFIEVVMDDPEEDTAQFSERLNDEVMIFIEDAEKNIEQISEMSGELSLPDADVPLDRIAAIEYAELWWSVRNDEWYSYDALGGNCNNFASQCLLAGGIPMDYSGSSQWKWYGHTPNSLPYATGRSPSWAGVEEFYQYAQTNSGYGMVTIPDAPYLSGEVGDILQMGFKDEWLHTVVIGEVVKDDDGNVIDYLIYSNTADQALYPASAYPYTMHRIIKVVGYNE